MTTASASERARALYASAIVIDAVCPLMEQPGRWVDWIDGGVTMAIPSLADADMPTAMRDIALWHERLRERENEIRYVSRAGDIARAKRDGRLAITFHFQDTMPIERDLRLIETYHRLGVRMFGLCYNQRNFVGDGCLEPADAGLSRFGVEAIREMERVGIIVDLSHTGYRTTMDALDLATRAPVFSHSNVRRLCDNRRNITDEQIRAVAAKGGVVGINGFPAFVKKGGQPTLAEYMDHIEYVVDLVGVDHVGLALDYYGKDTPELYARLIASGAWRADEYPPPPHVYPAGIETARGMPNVARELVERGHSDADVLKILGGNWLRVFREIWGE